MLALELGLHNCWCRRRVWPMSLAALTATGNAWMKVRSSQRLPMLLGQQRDAPKLTDFAGYEGVKVSAWDGLLRDPVPLKVASSYRMSHHWELDTWTQLPFHGLLKGKKALACFCSLRFSLLWTQHGTLPSTRSRGFYDHSESWRRFSLGNVTKWVSLII